MPVAYLTKRENHDTSILRMMNADARQNVLPSVVHEARAQGAHSRATRRGLAAGLAFALGASNIGGVLVAAALEKSDQARFEDVLAQEAKRLGR